MRLSAAELAYVRSQGLYITDKCDGCGKLLNQTFRYTIAGNPEVYCSAGCRDLAFFGDTREVKRRSAPGKCVFCGDTLEKKRRGALYCGEKCKKRAARSGKAHSMAEPQITGTPAQSNQRVASPKNDGQGRCIASGAKPIRNARGEVTAKFALPVEVAQATLGSRSS
jgi:Fe-S-cluster-containing dehydrogenase component